MTGDTLTQLGGRTELPANPDEAVLECVPNPHPDAPYLVRFTAPEFTSLCPVTGQPDFAHLVIDYVPEAAIVESKSLKLFLASFRNHGAFHEDCTVSIGKRLVDLSGQRSGAIKIVGVRVPAVQLNLDERDARLDQPSGQQAAGAEGRLSVSVAN